MKGGLGSKLLKGGGNRGVLQGLLRGDTRILDYSSNKLKAFGLRLQHPGPILRNRYTSADPKPVIYYQGLRVTGYNLRCVEATDRL